MEFVGWAVSGLFVSFLLQCHGRRNPRNTQVTSLGDCPADFVHMPPDRCYLIKEGSYRDGKDYNGAEEYCQSQNSTLASIETEDEMNFLAERFILPGTYHYISARRHANGQFYWNTGDRLDNNDPKFASDGKSSSLDCVSIATLSDRGFYCLGCWLLRPFICERFVDYFHPPSDCSRDPCVNGATCHDVNNFYRCDCVPGYTGSLCETEINECDSDPCVNGGTCVDGLNSFTCICAEQFFGKQCEAGPHDWCDAGFVRKQNKMQCFMVEESTMSASEAGIFCLDRGATLASVETQEDMEFLKQYATEGNSYHLGGLKDRGEETYYWNSHKEIPQNSPLWSPNSGVSRASVSDRACVTYFSDNQACGLQSGECDTEKGVICQTEMDYPAAEYNCSVISCINGGTCTDGTCQCPQGYGLEYCEKDNDECLSFPCLNGAECVDHVGSYSCRCETGFTGSDCQTDIDECNSSPCQHGSTCVDQINGYSCVCAPFFTGTHCHIDTRIQCPEGFVLNQETPRCYLINNNNKVRGTAAARRYCRDNDAALISFETTEERNFVVRYLTQRRWLYITSAEEDPNSMSGDHYWDSGVLLRYDDPTFNAYQFHQGWPCVGLGYRSASGQFLYYHMDCNSLGYVICERGPVN